MWWIFGLINIIIVLLFAWFFDKYIKEDAKWRHIYASNAFIGNYLRLELLYCHGEHEKLLENIRGYFIKMAKLTGTLWENETPTASCNHGFASHVLYWMDGLGMIN